jgi:hypothetical protein
MENSVITDDDHFEVLTLHDILHKHSGREKMMGGTDSPKSESGEF